jgi:hypothetical protein
VSGFLSLLMIVGDAIFWIWALIDHAVGFVLNLAGFQQNEDDGPRLPNWAACMALVALLGAVAVLLYAVLR